MSLPVTSAAVPPPRSIELWTIRDLALPALASLPVVGMTFGALTHPLDASRDIWFFRAVAVALFFMAVWAVRSLGPRRVLFAGDVAHVQWVWRHETFRRDDVKVDTDRQGAEDVEPFFQLVWVTAGRRIRFGLTLDDPRSDLLTSFGDASALSALQTAEDAPATSSLDDAAG